MDKKRVAAATAWRQQRVKDMQAELDKAETELRAAEIELAQLEDARAEERAKYEEEVAKGLRIDFSFFPLMGSGDERARKRQAVEKRLREWSRVRDDLRIKVGELSQVAGPLTDAALEVVLRKIEEKAVQDELDRHNINFDYATGRDGREALLRRLEQEYGITP